MNIALLVPD